MRITAISLLMLAAVVLGLVSVRGGDDAYERPKDQPPTPVSESPSFLGDVMPVLNKWGCNQSQCHGSAKGKGGMRLSMFGADPAADYEAFTRAAQGRRINRVEPAKSLMIAKSHFKIGTPEYDLLVSWIGQGAVWDNEKTPKLVGVTVAPKEQVLEKGAGRRLSVAARLADGTQKDVTGLAQFKSADGKIAAVDAGGNVKAEGYGQATIVASYMRAFDTVEIVVPQPLPDPFPSIEANNKVDELVFARLKKLGLPPSAVCTDEVFLRRVYLDAVGILPAPDEVKSFLADTDPQKRSKLIDRLLERDEFADFWALKWGDLLRIKSEYPVRIWPKAVQTYYQWLRDSIAHNKPYDQFVRELLLAGGSNFRSGAANYFRAVPSKDPQTIAETTALIFMGARIGCARCHGHPQENWSLADDLGLAAFFGKVAYKNTTEWKEEIVFINPKGSFRNPKTKEAVKPKLWGGEPLDLPPDEDPRGKFADWLTSPENPWFAKNIANRIWCWLMGRGIVHEPDDLRSTNPPSNPELLDYLVRELLDRKYDLKHVYRLVLNSKTYQLSSDPNQWNQNDAVHFSHYQTRRLMAEQLLDAISRVTENSERFSSRIPEPATRVPTGYGAIQLSDGNIESPFLEMFGRPPRDTPYEGERSCDVFLRHELYFVNSEHLEGKIANGERIKRLLKANKSDAEIVEELVLAALSRLPREEEKQTLVEYLAQGKGNRAQAVRDLVWAIVNTKEFEFNH
jgi:hypothetical protein